MSFISAEIKVNGKSITVFIKNQKGIKFHFNTSDGGSLKSASFFAMGGTHNEVYLLGHADSGLGSFTDTFGFASHESAVKKATWLSNALKELNEAYEKGWVPGILLGEDY